MPKSFAEARASLPTPTRLGEGQWVRSNPPRAIFVLVRHADKGRRDKTANGKRALKEAHPSGVRRARAMAVGGLNPVRDADSAQAGAALSPTDAN
jgi:hypothetical protein